MRGDSKPIPEEILTLHNKVFLSWFWRFQSLLNGWKHNLSTEEAVKYKCTKYENNSIWIINIELTLDTKIKHSNETLCIIALCVYKQQLSNNTRMSWCCIWWNTPWLSGLNNMQFTIQVYISVSPAEQPGHQCGVTGIQITWCVICVPVWGIISINYSDVCKINLLSQCTPCSTSSLFLGQDNVW